jgi:hypothetical protein
MPLFKPTYEVKEYYEKKNIYNVNLKDNVFTANYEEHYKDSRLHNDNDKPAIIVRIKDNIIEKEWFVEGKQHRENNPARITWNLDGTLYSEEWFIGGKRHRNNDKPAIIKYYETGVIFKEEWYFDGKQHRDNKPAEKGYLNNGLLFDEYWFQNGKMHREDGPAKIICWNSVNFKGVENNHYYLNGNKYSKEDFLVRIRRGKLKRLSKNNFWTWLK